MGLYGGQRFYIDSVKEQKVKFTNDVMSSIFPDITALDNIIPNAIYDITYVISSCCFIAGTQVLTDLNGHSKPIEDFIIGDEVVSYNIITNENYITQVKDVIINTNTTDIAEVMFDNGEILVMNAYHPLYCENGFKSITEYKGYDKLSIGDKVKTINGWSVITDIKRYDSKPIITYNLDVRDKNEDPDIDTNDTYYANNIVVKNGFC